MQNRVPFLLLTSVNGKSAIVKTVQSWLCSALLMLVASTIVRADQTIVIRSGNGSIGSQDSLVHALPYGTTGDITPTAANFAGAKTAPFAYVVTPYATYIPTLPSDPSAKWIATTPNLSQGSALFAVAFQVTDPVITSASLDFHFAVDNAVNGVYFNGTRISGNSLDGDYHAEYRFVRSDIAPLLIPNATNWLYVNMSDYGALAAVIFNATITTVGAGAQVIVPNRSGNAGTVTVTIPSQSFSPALPTAILRGAGQPDIIGNGSELVDATTLITTFDLQGALPGIRDVVVTQGGLTVLSLSGAFTIEQGGSAQLTINVLGPSNVRVGREATFDIVVKNVGNIDANYVLVQSTALQQPETGLDTTFGAVSAREMTVTEPKTEAAAANSAAALSAPAMGAFGSLAPNQIGTVAGKFTAVPICVPVPATAQSNKRQETCNFLQQEAVILRQKFQTNLIQEEGIKRQLLAGNCYSFPTSGNCPALFMRLNTILQNRADLRRKYNLICRQLEKLCGIVCPPIEGSGPSSQALLRRETSSEQTFGNVDLATVSQLVATSSTASTNQTVSGSTTTCGVSSVDPNDKVGTTGSGAQHYIAGAIPLAYTILFENLATASAPAADVVINDPLSSNVDSSTVVVQSIRFGSVSVPLPAGTQNLDTVIDLRPSRNVLVEVTSQVTGGVLQVKFVSLDPATGLPVTDPFAGFLPPNKMPPEGEGSISFLVMPKPGLSTGTQILNTAAVTFDVNQPIQTPQWFNTVDSTRPVSNVIPLGANQNSPQFAVQWQSSDVGSGIQDVTVYVSNNAGPFAPWLTQTTLRQATFAGQPGHTYRFYSIARDAVGNVENAKSTPGATTTVQAGILGDVNGDGKVDCADIAIVKAAFGTSAGDPKYDVRADVNGDGVVDIRDLAFVAQHLSPVTVCQ